MSTGPRRRSTEGFTAVEVSLIFAVLGVLLAAAVPAFVRATRLSKVAEAQEELARLHQRAALYYATPQVVDGKKQLRCLPDAAGPTPEVPSAEPKAVDFSAAEAKGAQTWHALGFAPANPVRYRYSFVPALPGCSRAAELPVGAPLLTLRAEGDLDADGTLSRFERTARDRDGDLVLDELLVVEDRIE